MQTLGIANLQTQAQLLGSQMRADRAQGFGAALRAAEARPAGAPDRAANAHAPTNTSPDADAREWAQKFVATHLVRPLFAQFRKDPLRSEMFHGGFGEEVFQAHLDEILADRFVASSRLSVVDQVFDRITRRGRHAPPSAPTAKVETHA